MSNDVNVANITATLRATDQLSPVVRSAAQISSAEMGKLQAAVLAANTEVQALSKQWKAMQGAGAVQNEIANQLGEATIKATLLQTQLASVKGAIKDSLKPPDPPGSPDSLPSYFEKLQTQATAYFTGMVAFSATMGTVKGAWSAVRGEITDSLQAWGEQEQQTVRLTAALRAQGFATPEVIRQETELASTFQQTTRYGDQQIESMEALLVQIGGVMPRDMQRGLQAATDLAAGLGVDLETATRLVGKAYEGNYTSLSRYGIVIDKTAIQAQGAVAVFDSIEKHFGGQAAASAETFAGKVDQIGNAWTNVQENIGKIIAQNPIVVGALDELLNKLNDLAGRKSSGDIDFNERDSWAKIINSLQLPLTGKDLGELQQELLIQQQIASIAKGLQVGGNLPTAAVSGGMKMADALAAMNDQQKVQIALLDLSTKGELSHGAAETQAANAAFAHGQSVSETLKFLEAHGVAVASDKDALDALHKTYEDGVQSQQKYADAVAKVTALMAGPDALDGTVAEAIKYFLALGATQSDLATYFGVSESAVKAVAESMAQAKEQTRLWNDEVKQLNASIHTLTIDQAAKLLPNNGSDVILPTDPNNGTAKYGSDFIKLQDVGKDASEHAEQTAKDLRAAKQPADELVHTLGTMATALQEVARVSTGAFGVVVSELASAAQGARTAAQAMKEFHAAGATTGDKINAVIAAGAAGLGVLGDINAASKGQSAGLAGLGGALSGAEFGAAFGPIGAGIGALAGAVTGLVSSLTGPSKAELQTRTDRTNAGLTDASAIQADESALMQFGATAQQAQRLVGAALDAKTPQAFAAAMVPVNAALARTKSVETDVTSVVQQVQTQFVQAGHAIPDALKASINSLANMKGITEDEKAALLALTADVKPNFDDLMNTATKYGITLQQLGPQFQQSKIEETAKGIFQDFTDLTKAGADVGGVLGGMSDEISKLVTDSMQFGTSIPDNMKPLIQNLIDSGQLTDTNGQAIKDMTKITFEGTPLDQSLSNLNTTIDHLADVLQHIPGYATDAANALQSVQGPNNAGSYNARGGLIRHGGVEHFITGGIAGLGMFPSGTDTEPAMLTPGEMVLNSNQQSAIGALLAGGGGTHARGRDDEILKEMKTLNTRLAFIDSLPEDMARALGSVIRKRLN